MSRSKKIGDLPAAFVVGIPGKRLRVRQERIPQTALLKRLGYVSVKDGIVIHSGQSEVSKQATLLHEILHVVDDALVDNGVVARKPSHAHVEWSAVLLLRILTAAGLWRGVSARRAREYFSRFAAEELAEARRAVRARSRP